MMKNFYPMVGAFWQVDVLKLVGGTLIWTMRKIDGLLFFIDG